MILSNRAFMLGFVKEAESVSWFGVGESTGDAMNRSLDPSLSMAERIKAHQAFNELRSKESPMSHLKVLAAGGIAGAIPFAIGGAINLVKGRLSPLRTLGAMAAGGSVGAGLMELIRGAQGSQISKAKKLVKEGPEATEEAFLREEFEPKGKPGTVRHALLTAAPVAVPLALLGAHYLIKRRQAADAEELLRKAWKAGKKDQADKTWDAFRAYVAKGSKDTPSGGA